MQYSYGRPDQRFSLEKQTPLFTSPKGKWFLEPRRRDGDPFTEREKLISILRPKDHDTVEVSDFHRLATDKIGLNAVVRAIDAKAATIKEARTGRLSSSKGDLADMLAEAYAYYAGGTLSHLDAVERGKKGAANSPVTKRKEKRMPWELAIKILNKALTIDLGIAQINRNRKYKAPYNRPFVYKMNAKMKRDKEIKLMLEPRLSGRQQVDPEA